MIMSGWILPDLYEVQCKSCSTFNGHIEVVKRYLNNLQTRDNKTYNKIMNEFYNLNATSILVGLDDFAVMKLDWIKINNEPIKILFYTKNNELDFLVEKYINIGYTPVILDKKIPIIQPNIPSRELI